MLWLRLGAVFWEVVHFVILFFGGMWIANALGADGWTEYVGGAIAVWMYIPFNGLRYHSDIHVVGYDGPHAEEVIRELPVSKEDREKLEKILGEMFSDEIKKKND